MRKMVCCEVFRELIESITLPSDLEVSYLERHLHRVPKRLHAEVQQVLLQEKGYEEIVLGYGLCGNGLNQISGCDCPLIMPRVHDCIPVLYGSKEAYEAMHREKPKTFYYSCGMDFFTTEDYIASLEKFGAKETKAIYQWMFAGYERILFIHIDHPNNAAKLTEAQKLAAFLELPCDEVTGSTAYLQQLLWGPWQDEALFLKVPPQGEILQEDFL